MEIIWAVYERETGAFAGSGTPYFDNETYGSTVALPDPPENCGAVWDGTMWVYPPAPDPDALP
jgi:hypothetical protein